MERCCLISAAFVTFLGLSTEDERERIIAQWIQEAHLPTDFEIIKFLSTETEQLNWKNKGLPASQIAIENTTMIFNSTQIPFIIDPTGKISTFLLNYLKEISGKLASIELLNGSQNDLITQIELGVRFGKICIIDDILDIDPALSALLRRDFSSQGPRQVVQLGDKSIDLNESFKLFFCSKNEQIKLQSFVRASVTEVNFSTTKSGLASQLLSAAIGIEKPELEVKSSELTSQAETMKLQLDELEQILLNVSYRSRSSS